LPLVSLLTLVGSLLVSSRAIAAQGDLVAFLSDSPDPVVAGQTLTYTAIVSNAGPDTVTGVAASLGQPGSAHLVSAVPTQGTVTSSGPGNDLNWEIGSLASNAVTTLVVALIPYDEAGSQFYSELTVSHEDDELDPGNDRASVETEVQEGPGVLRFEYASFGANEAAGVREIAVIRTGGAAGEVTVQFATLDGSAVAPGDYSSTNGTLTFPDGETYLTFEVTIHDDTESECNEPLSLVLFNPTGGAVLVVDTNAPLTLFDNDLAAPAPLKCVTASASGTQTANGDSSWRAVSADGRHVAFTCSGNNLITNPITSGAQVFAHDLASNTVVLVTRSLSGTAGANASSLRTAISDDGGVIAYQSSASNLHALVTNFTSALYAWHRVTLSNELITLNLAGTGPSTGGVSGLKISADGTRAGFISTGQDLVAIPDTNGLADYFVRDLSAGLTHLVTVNTNGLTANGQILEASLSGDGKVVAFDSSATDLAPGTGGSPYNVFARNLVSGTTVLVSVNTNGVGEGNDMSLAPQTDNKGQRVGFVSVATDLVTNVLNGLQQVYLRNLAAETTSLVSVNTNGQAANAGCGPFALSPNGRFVVFASTASDLVPGDINGVNDVFLRDLALGTTTLVSVGCDGSPGDASSGFPQVSADGRYVVFASDARNLVAGQPPSGQQVYRRDLVTGETVMVSRKPVELTPAIGLNYDPAISANGQTVVFSSTATDLAGDLGLADNNSSTDFFAWVAPATPPLNPPVLNIASGPGGSLTISWTPDTGTNWVLQERTNLTSGNWSNSSSGPTNPVTVPAPLPANFFRLFKP
jgi:Tol biopolymer transport system component